MFSTYPHPHHDFNVFLSLGIFSSSTYYKKAWTIYFRTIPHYSCNTLKETFVVSRCSLT